MAAKILIFGQSGTPVFRINGTQKTQIGISSDWNIRLRPQSHSSGCPRWIDTIVIAPSIEAARKARKLSQMPGVSNSPFSSRDVSVIHVDGTGDVATQESVPFVFIPKFHISVQESGFKGIPIAVADEIWFSTEPFNSVQAKLQDPTAQDVERLC